MDRSVINIPAMTVSLFLNLSAAAPAAADLYSYENKAGNYVISKERPTGVGEYAVLTDDGEFIELIRSVELNVPITHWRPWYLPQEPNPFDPVKPVEPPEPNVIIEEVDEYRTQRTDNE